MIIAERKPLGELLEMIDRAGNVEKLLVVGCRECVTVCFAGGEKETAETASALRIAFSKAGKRIEISEDMTQRTCENEFVDAIADKIREADAIISLACGVGTQTIAERVPDALVLPGVNTTSYGRPIEHGVWSEYCAGCGNCILHLTGGICPIARCSKSLLNGPCGGSKNGTCEVDKDMPCGWQLIYDRLKKLGRLAELEKIQPPKDWSTSSAAGVRKTVRKDVQLTPSEGR